MLAREFKEINCYCDCNPRRYCVFVGQTPERNSVRGFLALLNPNVQISRAKTLTDGAYSYCMTDPNQLILLAKEEKEEIVRLQDSLSLMGKSNAGFPRTPWPDLTRSKCSVRCRTRLSDTRAIRTANGAPELASEAQNLRKCSCQEYMCGACRRIRTIIGSPSEPKTTFDDGRITTLE